MVASLSSDLEALDAPSVRPATPGDIEDIIKLVRELWPKISPDEFRAAFNPPWWHEAPQIGFVIIAGGKLVGFLGTVCASRVVDGQSLETANLTCWYVRPEHRTSSLSLLQAVMRTGRTITVVTPAPLTRQLMTTLGFKPLEQERYVYFPFLNLDTLFRGKDVELITEPSAIAPYLDAPHRTILKDHVNTGTHHYLLRAGEEYCYLITTRRMRNIIPRRVADRCSRLIESVLPGARNGSSNTQDTDQNGRADDAGQTSSVWRRLSEKISALAQVPLSEVLFCSNPDLLRCHLERVKLGILWHDKSIALLGDQRFFGAKAPFGLRFEAPKYYRGGSLTPQQLDNLYTEIVLLPI